MENFEGIRIGDKVKLTRSNGDELTITVFSVSSSLTSGATNWVGDVTRREYGAHDWDGVQVLARSRSRQ